MIQKKIADFLFSTRLMSVLFIVFAIAMAIGTFIEDMHSTAYARIYIYNTKWFELIMVLMAINFFGNIKRYKLWRREKWMTLLFHLSFLFIIIGAGITRYISFEGIMPIQNGETTDVFFSEKTYLSTFIDGEVDGEMLRKSTDFEVLLAGGANNHHKIKTDFKGQKVEFEITDFYQGAKRTVIEDENGVRFLKMVDAATGQRNDFYLREGQTRSLNNILIAFNNETDGAININLDEAGNYTIDSPFPGDWMRMADQETGQLVEDSIQPLQLRSLYSIGALQIVFPEEVMVGIYDIVPDKTQAKNGDDAVVLTVRTNGEEQEVKLLGTQGNPGNFVDLKLGGLDIHVRYGSKEHKLPFEVTLDQFIAEKYPGTANNPTPSYSSFKSKVTVANPDGTSSKHEIYMNHVLDHKGYRFFQASFMPDESGTVLSVNHDRWGTLVTYIGYTLLYIGMVLFLFIRGSRFRDLGARLNKLKKSKDRKKEKLLGILVVLLLLGSFTAEAQVRKEDYPQNKQNTEEVQEQRDTLRSRAEEVDAVQRELMGQHLSLEELIGIIKENAVPLEHADKFGELIIQDYQGRMKPINTYSSELLRKLSKKDHFEGLDSDQVLISMTQNPLIWYNIPIIKIKSKNDSLRGMLGMKEGESSAKFIQFFDQTGEYKLGPYLEEAYREKSKNKFQEDMVKADGQVNLLYNALQGELLRIFPIPGDEDNKWLSYPEILENPINYEGRDSLFVANALPLYMRSLYDGNKANDFTQADQLFRSIKGFQRKYAEDILPSDQHVKAEIYYNKHDVFQNLFWQYLVAGSILFFLVILELFYTKRWIGYAIKAGTIAVWVLFALHTIGLLARWYISGHAPWSDAYESVIFVGWATVIFGLLFGRKSDLTVASTAFVAAMIMMIAHWNWMDPSIANLEPVLDSYWLMIHVSVIVSSYGPFTLGMILGVVSLLLMIFTNDRNYQKMKLNIREITIITEMALIVGLVLLTIGNFLGGQWANESWGRYWSWDPKETWALISIMVYSFVVHLHMVPGLRSRFAFNWITILAYGSILMTYFGVNFYLSGLHSYASGDQIISYKFIAGALAGWGILGWLAYRKYKKYYKRGKQRGVI